MPHIVLITPVFAINDEDTINVPFIQLFCKELLRREVTLTIVSEKYPLSGNYHWNGANVHTVKQKTPRIFYKFLRKKKLYDVLEEIHSKEKIDVIHNFWFNILGAISEKFAKRNTIAHITTMSGQDVLPDNPFLKQANTYKGRLFCLSPFHRLQLSRYSKAEAEVISWGIEPIHYHKKERIIDLIICGWINSVKNHDLFLQIVDRLRNENTKVKAVICGGGPLFDDLIKKVHERGLNKIIEIKNSIPRSEVLDLMQQSKILVHTSNFESYGLVLAEGLACGCQVISTPVGVAWKNNDIITCDSTEEFVTQIKQVLNNRIQSATPNMSNYLIQNTVDEYMKVYTGWKAK